MLRRTPFQCWLTYPFTGSFDAADLNQEQIPELVLVSLPTMEREPELRPTKDLRLQSLTDRKDLQRLWAHSPSSCPCLP